MPLWLAEYSFEKEKRADVYRIDGADQEVAEPGRSVTPSDDRWRDRRDRVEDPGLRPDGSHLGFASVAPIKVKTVNRGD